MSIWAGDPPNPVEPAWALIAHFEESRSGPETFALEFMSEDNDVVAHFQFEALEIAIDQAQDLAGIAKHSWRECDVATPDQESYPTRSAIRQAGERLSGMTQQEARNALRLQLLELSELAMSAQWYGDLEFIVWDRLGRGESRLGNAQLSASTLERLRDLSQHAGGWFMHSDEQEGRTGDPCVFVGATEWDQHFQSWLERVPPHDRPRDR